MLTPIQEVALVKSELIERLYRYFPKTESKLFENAVNTILACLTETLVEGKRIEIRGQGSFSTKKEDRKVAHNPKTGVKVIVHPKRKVAFKPSKNLKWPL